MECNQDGLTSPVGQSPLRLLAKHLFFLFLLLHRTILIASSPFRLWGDGWDTLHWHVNASLTDSTVSSSTSPIACSLAYSNKEYVIGEPKRDCACKRIPIVSHAASSLLLVTSLECYVPFAKLTSVKRAETMARLDSNVLLGRRNVRPLTCLHMKTLTDDCCKWSPD